MWFTAACPSWLTGCDKGTRWDTQPAGENPGAPRPGGAGGEGGGVLCAVAEELSRTSRKTPPAFDNSESAGGWKDLSAEQRGSARTEGSRQRLSARLPEAEAAAAQALEGRSAGRADRDTSRP